MAPAKNALTILAVLALAAGGYIAIAPSCAAPGPTVSLPPEPAPLRARQSVEINGRTFDLELALTNSERFQGLSDRRSVDADGGMLFVYPSERSLGFVMRRCHVPIDIILLDAGGRVVAMHEMPVIEPIGSEAWFYPDQTYSSDEPAQMAIEFRAGTLDALGLEVGDVIALPLEELKGRARR
ncbi:MAG: DUF192 domain-containing protein [Phycisphaerales bacterium JB063]